LINFNGFISNASAVIQFSPENSTTFFSIYITISKPIHGYDFQVYFKSVSLCANCPDLTSYPLTKNIVNGTEIEISVPGISLIGFGLSNNHTTYTKHIHALIFYEGNALDANKNGFYFDEFDGSAQCFADNNSKYLTTRTVS
jgi:hypothetical protein